MSDRVQIIIEARETASRAFQQVASGADRMDQSLDRAEQSASRFSRAGAALGAVIGATSGLLSDSARAAAEAEVSQERLRAAIEASGDTFEEYASQLEAAGEAAVAMGFDDEAALDSIARLTAATGDAGAAIENLGLIMDIARGRGISLADATRIVEAVETGRMETLRRLGIVLDENATKEEALAELQQRYAGQAEAYADSAAGAYDRIRVQLGNLQETIGEHSGSMQLLLMSLPGLSAGYTAAAAAIGGLRSQLTATSATTVGMVGRFRLLSTAATGLATSMGPLGLVAAAVAATAAIDAFTDEMGAQFHQIGEESIATIDALIAKVVELGDTSALATYVVGLDTITAGLERQNEEYNNALSILPEYVNLARQVDDANVDTVEGIDRATLAAAGLSEAVLDLIDANSDGIFTLEELTTGFADVEAAAALTQDAIDGLAAGADEMAEIFAMTGEGAALAKSEALAYTQALIEGAIDGAEYERLLDALITGYGNTAEAAIESGEATTQYTAAMDEAKEALDELSSAAVAAAVAWRTWTSGAGDAVAELEEVTPAMEDAASAMEALNESALTAAVSWRAWITGAREAAEAAEEITPAMEAAANAMSALNETALSAAVAWRGGFSDTAEEAAAKAAELADTLRNDLAVTMDLVTGQFTATTNALDAGFRVIVGNTNAIASQSQAVADWATELIDVEGTYSQLDDLLANHTITQQQYVAAQRAHNTILADNAMIQNDILGIQAESAPVIASLMASQARYVNELQNAEPAAQALALAYMDTATSARALELAQIAASEAPGFEGLIEGAIAANPLIEAILTDMGIVSRGAEGELIINTEGETEVEALTTAIESLEDTIVSVFVEVDDSALEGLRDRLNPFGGSGMMGDGGSGMAFNIAVTADTSEADARIDETTSKLSEWDGATATGDVLADNADANSKIDEAQDNLRTWDDSAGNAAIEATDNASGKISSVISLLNSVPRSVTTTLTTNVVTNYITTGIPSGVGRAALGGVMDGYADGGVVAEMAEWGAEMLHFPNGGVAIAPSRGLYAVPQGTYVDTAPATAAKMSGLGGLTVNLHVGGNVIGVDDLAAEVSTKIVPAIQRAYQQHARGYA